MAFPGKPVYVWNGIKYVGPYNSAHCDHASLFTLSGLNPRLPILVYLPRNLGRIEGIAAMGSTSGQLLRIAENLDRNELSTAFVDRSKEVKRTWGKFSPPEDSCY